MEITQELAQEIRNYSWRLNRKLAAESESASTLTAPQESVAVCVYQNPGLTGAELSRILFISPQSINSTVNWMVKQDYLEMRKSSTDARRRELFLTDRGTGAVHNIRVRRTAWLAGRLQDLPRADQEAALRVVKTLNSATFAE